MFFIMITDPAAAAKLLNAAFEAYCGVDAALGQIAPELPAEELAACKRQVGKVMGSILFELAEPILERHPELTPEAWRQ